MHDEIIDFCKEGNAFGSAFLYPSFELLESFGPDFSYSLFADVTGTFDAFGWDAFFSITFFQTLFLALGLIHQAVYT